MEYLTCPDGDPSLASPGKMYLDRDVYGGPEPPSTAVVERHTIDVLTNVKLLVDRMSTAYNDLTFVVATRHGFCPGEKEHKLSFRPFVQGMSIRYTDVARVIRLMGQDDFWDMSVYKPSKQMYLWRGDVECFPWELETNNFV